MQYAVQADLRGMLTASRRCVVFTGAGISTQSGIPDYRSPGGLWSRYRPVEFDDFLASEEARREFRTCGRGPGHRRVAAPGHRDRGHHPKRRRVARGLRSFGRERHRAAWQHDLRGLPGLRETLRAGADPPGGRGHSGSVAGRAAFRGRFLSGSSRRRVYRSLPNATGPAWSSSTGRPPNWT